MTTYLLIGACGSGKTWVANQLIKAFNLTRAEQAGLYHWVTNGEIVLLGRYDGTVFEGGDRLSMAVMSENKKVVPQLLYKTVIAEGDRFTNSTFLQDFNPIVLRIRDRGHEGRAARGTEQSERHIKAIRTRVQNMPADFIVQDSDEALRVLTEQLSHPTLTHKSPPQQNLF